MCCNTSKLLWDEEENIHHRKNDLAVAHVFKWLELITLAAYNQSYE